MNTATLIATSATTFILCAENANGGWRKIGFIRTQEPGKKISLDPIVQKFFPPNTRSRKDALASCKYLSLETQAQSVDWQVRNLRIRTCKVD